MPSIVTFAEYSVNPAIGSVTGPEGNVHIEPKNMDVLLVLLNADGEVVSREDILQQVWTNQEVSDDVINTAISKIRKALSEVSNSNKYLQTIPRKGYRLVYPKSANVTAIHPNRLRDVNLAMQSQEALQPKPTTSVDIKLQAAIEDTVVPISKPLSIVPKPRNDKTTEQILSVPLPKSKRAHYIWGLTLIVAVIVLQIIYSSWQQRILENDVLLLHKQQVLSYSSFVIQAKRRNELVDMISQRLTIERTEQFEKFFAKYHSMMNKEELFVFDQIRGITTGALYSSNTAMLKLIDNNQQITREFPLIKVLHNHLAFWVSKYQNVFIIRDDMCLLYVGVEDGVPYPSELDKQITQWLKERALI